MDETDRQYYCDKCGKPFKFSYNLTVHLEKVHGITKAKQCNPSSSVNICDVCNKSFCSKYNLKVHKKNIHKVEEVVQSLKKFSCDNCESKFSWEKDLKTHVKTKHSTFSPDRTSSNDAPAGPSRPTICNSVDVGLECLLCKPGQFKTVERAELEEHFEINHHIKIENTSFTFESFEDFKKWKIEEETKTSSKFVVERGPRTVREGTLYSYECHRSGFYKTKGNALRHLKTQGSCKINSICPAKLRLVKLEDDTFELKYCRTHVGHDNNIAHLQLSSSDREMLAQQIAIKKPFDDILDDVRKSIGQHAHQRLDLLTRKDLHNVEKEFNLNNDGVLHQDDAVSVQCWVDSVKESDDKCIKFYKAQGLSADPNEILQEGLVLQKDDFCLIIMSDVQRDLLQKFGTQKITVDSTHGVGNYGFQLVTIMVIDDLNQGFPAAFMITNRVTYSMMQGFFTVVKASAGLIQTKVFMSDMEESFYTAWVNVMEKPEKRLFCSWHVDRAWRKNIRSKIKSMSKQTEAYKYLRMLLLERDETVFNQLVGKFISFLTKEADMVDFAKYFNDYYVSRKECWAYCYRKGSGLNTNMHLERMHKTLKYIYFKGKNIKRLDKALYAIMKLTRDKVVDRLIILNKGKVTTKLTAIRQRHKTSLELNPTVVMECDEGWIVPTSLDHDELYLVSSNKLQSNCTCRLVCDACHCCIHNYSCTCIDSEIRGNMCKHIHLVCSLLVTNQNNEIKRDNLRTMPSYEPQEETTTIIKHLGSQCPEKPSDNAQRSLALDKQLFHDKVTEVLGSITSKDEMTVMWRMLKRAETELKAVNLNQSFIKITNEPANKKVVPQVPNFKRKREKSKKIKVNKMVNPSVKERHQMSQTLMLQVSDEEDVSQVDDMDLDQTFC